ncbi:hypothetical protein brsh051_17720 [Brooklawnia propionicigenes]|jgi:hypothetical protein|uniref:Wadjet protein JetD C-terminal domain-containing protein n=1 Tax=Brooklawnia propionicigenes TaxID=3041175 RepID=A0AAN0K703_9ACTN|nr:Wadjet anti-phage system protein JetD domain-containing protein [Brooklawnia sp. SH051]BEH02491.1 hypothetical protein brsh051_17720 [Brooklawnia sp. SH051]
MSHGRTDLTEQLSAFIGSYPRMRVPLAALREHAIQNDPAFVSDPSARQRLHSSLTELQDRLEISWPKGRTGLDTRALPELPRWVARVAAERTPDRAPIRPRVWPSVLEPAARVATRPDEQDLLTAIASWMAANPTPVVVPMQERSLEITGDEKRFDKLRSTRLFTTGALTLDLLACAPALLPFASTHVDGAGPTQLLVAENSATYQSLTQALFTLPTSTRPDTHVVWGAGRQFPISAEHVLLLDPAPASFLYFGDLDVAGLQIACDADATIHRVTGGHLIPATSLYRAALEYGVPRPDPSNKATPAHHAQLLAWVSAELQDGVEKLLRTRTRIPQESVGLTLLLRCPELLRC